MGALSPPTTQPNSRLAVRTILRIIRRYALFGAIWICGSDIAVYLHGGETRQDVALSAIKGLLFVAVSAISLYLIIRNSVKDTVLERDSYRERLRDLSMNGNDIVLLESADGRILEANDRAIATYGFSSQQLCGMSLTDLVTEPCAFRDRWKDLLEKGSLRAETIHKRADGSTFPVEFSSRLLDVGGSNLVHSVIRDISERQESERQVLKLKDAYAALFQTNQCIAQCTDRDELFRRTCEIAVDRTHLKLAWVGIVDPTTTAILPVAKAGPSSENVAGLRVSIDPESPWSKGIGGQALLSGKAIIVNDLWKSEGFQPWMERLYAYGIQSWAAFPIFKAERAVGFFALYSESPEFFSPELSSLLEEMVRDVSLALDRLDSAAKQAELQAELSKLKKAVEHSQVTVVITDRRGVIQYVNPAFTATSGYSQDEVLGKNPSILKSGETSQGEYAEMWRLLNSGESWAGEFHNKRKDGNLYWEEAAISPVTDARGEITHFIAVKQDITARREAEAKARFLAFHDALTELPNRSVARGKMIEAMREADRSGIRAAVLFIDVDNLKRVNDSLGHNIGDRLLQSLAKRLRTCMREGDLLSRVSGDEFLFVISNLHNNDIVDGIANRIRESLAAPLNIDGLELSTTVSIGAAIYPDHGRSFEELCRRADLAMYSAKGEGRDSFRFYTKSMESGGHDYLAVVNGLRKALERHEFVLHYQPQVHLETGEVRAVEALLRWQRPGHGLTLPGTFITIAEDSGLIIPIGNWVIQEVCRQAAEWHSSGLPDLRVAFNLSALQLRKGGLEKTITSALSQSRLAPGLLELELTESALVHDNAAVANYLAQLKALGIEIALDDFGTGYSNFTYLRHFELDRLKIDQSLVRHVTAKKKGDVAIVKSIVQLARNFGLETIAEGVETEEALSVVRRAGCDYAQGFLLARPMPAPEAAVYISSRGSVFNDLSVKSRKLGPVPSNRVQ